MHAPTDVSLKIEACHMHKVQKKLMNVIGKNIPIMMFT